jgi:adenylate kinase
MSNNNYKTVLLFGAPGVGKGTQGKVLGSIPGFFHLSCGDVFRSIDIASQDGKDIYQYSSRGELVPDELTVKIWRNGLDAQIALSAFKPHEDLLILDGIPRNVQQVELLKDHVEVIRVIYLVCSDEEAMVHRLKQRAIHENRADDANEDVIRRRYEVYREESASVIDMYPKEMVYQVDAMESPAEVLQEVLKILIPIQHFR